MIKLIYASLFIALISSSSTIAGKFKKRADIRERTRYEQTHYHEDEQGLSDRSGEDDDDELLSGRDSERSEEDYCDGEEGCGFEERSDSDSARDDPYDTNDDEFATWQEDNEFSDTNISNDPDDNDEWYAEQQRDKVLFQSSLNQIKQDEQEFQESTSHASGSSKTVKLKTSNEAMNQENEDGHESETDDDDQNEQKFVLSAKECNREKYRRHTLSRARVFSKTHHNHSLHSLKKELAAMNLNAIGTRHETKLRNAYRRFMQRECSMPELIQHQKPNASSKPPSIRNEHHKTKFTTPHGVPKVHPSPRVPVERRLPFIHKSEQVVFTSPITPVINLACIVAYSKVNRCDLIRYFEQRLPFHH